MSEARTSYPMPAFPALPPLAELSREQLIDVVHRLDSALREAGRLFGVLESRLSTLERKSGDE